MKKNLRIVSAAAAALLAVAPVAATAMPVNAADITNVTLGGTNAPAVNSDITVSSNLQAVTRPDQTVIDNNSGKVTYHMWNGQVNGTLTASFGGQTYTANLAANSSKVTVYRLKSGVKNPNTLSDYEEVKPNSQNIYRLEPGVKYFVRVENISFNFGTANANRSSLTVSGNNGINFLYTGKQLASVSSLDRGFYNGSLDGLKTVEAQHHDSTLTNGAKADDKGVTVSNEGSFKILSGTADTVTVLYTSNHGAKHQAVLKASEVLNRVNAQIAKTNANRTLSSKAVVNTDQNGALAGTLDAFVPVVPTDVTNSKSVSFYEIANGNEVTTGSLNLTANPTSHELNVNTVLAAAKAKYAAHQLENGASNGASVSLTTDVKDLTDQLTKAGIKVDANGNFQAPASFSFNLAAKSAQNAATATLPITVSVANAAQTPAAQETTKNVTIMHISTIYDKNGKATHEPALRAYNTVSVVSDPVTLKDETGKDAGKFYKLAGKDQYIKVGNVDGTSRSLKHNSYVYKSTGKRANKKTLKKGSSVTTYGKSFMIAGHQMYRIGKNQYVKKANF